MNELWIKCSECGNGYNIIEIRNCYPSVSSSLINSIKITKRGVLKIKCKCGHIIMQEEIEIK